MCGRFVNIEKKEKILKLFPYSRILNYSKKSYNISPSNLINVIYKNNNNIYIDNLFWSFSYFNICFSLYIQQNIKERFVSYGNNSII